MWEPFRKTPGLNAMLNTTAQKINYLISRQIRVIGLRCECCFREERFNNSLWSQTKSSLRMKSENVFISVITTSITTHLLSNYHKRNPRQSQCSTTAAVKVGKVFISKHCSPLQMDLNTVFFFSTRCNKLTSASTHRNYLWDILICCLAGVTPSRPGMLRFTRHQHQLEMSAAKNVQTHISDQSAMNNNHRLPVNTFYILLKDRLIYLDLLVSVAFLYRYGIITFRWITGPCSNNLNVFCYHRKHPSRGSAVQEHSGKTEFWCSTKRSDAFTSSRPASEWKKNTTFCTKICFLNGPEIKHKAGRAQTGILHQNPSALQREYLLLQPSATVNP